LSEYDSAVLANGEAGMRPNWYLPRATEPPRWRDGRSNSGGPVPPSPTPRGRWRPGLRRTLGARCPGAASICVSPFSVTKFGCREIGRSGISSTKRSSFTNALLMSEIWEFATALSSVRACLQLPRQQGPHDRGIPTGGPPNLPGLPESRQQTRSRSTEAASAFAQLDAVPGAVSYAVSRILSQSL
jgi:hypothetical protein